MWTVRDNLISVLPVTQMLAPHPYASGIFCSSFALPSGLVPAGWRRENPGGGCPS